MQFIEAGLASSPESRQMIIQRALGDFQTFLQVILPDIERYALPRPVPQGA
ncbi:hypothetical protein [Vibrio phage BONAISHI]|nr:hypothetical protein [Vibrio phage BONAISHI]